MADQYNRVNMSVTLSRPNSCSRMRRTWVLLRYFVDFAFAAAADWIWETSGTVHFVQAHVVAFRKPSR